MKKIIIFIILASYFLLPTATFAHGGTNDENNVIRMTDNGFEPKELTVTLGDEVTFINNGDVLHWPASNFHPTHTLYPEFDPLKGIPSGGSWKFKFEKAGTWRMHDHLFPHFTGTIVVLENPDAEGQTLSTDSQGLTLKNPGFWAKVKVFFLKLFRGSKASTLSEFKALDEHGKYAWLEDMASKESPEAAWRYIKAAYDTPNGVVGNPHDMAHLVGQLIYKKHGFNGLSICEPIFAFGCYHGLMETAFNKDKDLPEGYRKDLLLAQAGCGEVAPATSPTYWSCIHGMGHGIATYREHELDKSLADCELLDKEVNIYCHDGVFMEFSISAPANFYKTNDPIYPCNAIDENYKVACARSQVQVMRLRLGLGTKAIASACESTENNKIVFHCIDALGYFIGQTSPADASGIISGCQEIEDEAAAAQCLAAAAGELVFQNSAGWQKAADNICRSLRGNYQTLCRARVEQVKESYGRK